MCEEKIERILKTYKPVEGMNGYVWLTRDTVIELRLLREAYMENLEKIGEITDERSKTDIP